MDLNTVNVVEKKLNCALDANELNDITKLLSTMPGYIHDIRQTEMGHKAVLKHLLNLADNNPDSKGGYELGIGSVKASIFTTSEWIDRALQNNRFICSILAYLRRNGDVFQDSDYVDLHKMSNVRLLMNPNEMPPHINLSADCQHVKQRTQEWFSLHKKAVVTASSAYNALGLRTLQEQCDHFKQYVEHAPVQLHSKEVQKRLDYGSKNEVSSFSLACRKLYGRTYDVQ